jgi:vacuolar-type H+-ATPase subunit C/Vma6
MSIYAYATALARVYKSQTLTRGTINELLESEDWKDAISILREKGIISETPSSILDFDIMIKRKSLEILRKLRGYTLSSSISSSIVDLYEFFFKLDDLEALIASAYFHNSSPRLSILTELMELKPQSYEDVLASLKGIERDALKYAIDKSVKKTPSEIGSFLEYYFIKSLSKIVEEMKGDWKGKADEIICGYKDYYTISLAYNLKVQEDLTCKISRDVVRDIANSTNEKEVLDLLTRTPYSKSISGLDVYSALASLKRVARINARNASLNAFMGSPFTPVTVMAIAELIRLDTEDLITIVNGLALHSVDKVKSSVSFELI